MRPTTFGLGEQQRPIGDSGGGHELGCKVATVNYLMKALREAYDANTTLSAVYRMMERDGLVDVD